MYFLYRLLRDGYTVVYEKVYAGKVFVFPPTGECRVFLGIANDVAVPELKSPRAVHIFDACAGKHAREPLQHNAKVAVVTSPNEISYKQLSRSGASWLTVPSYSRAELDKRRVHFPAVTDDAYRQKIDMCGCGSIRLVLGFELAMTVRTIENAISNTTVSNMLDIAQQKEVDAKKGIEGPHLLFAASLPLDASKRDISSYRRLPWNIASPYIMHELISRCKDEAMLFAERAAFVFQNTPGLQATAGLFFEVILSCDVILDMH